MNHEPTPDSALLDAELEILLRGEAPGASRSRTRLATRPQSQPGLVALPPRPTPRNAAAAAACVLLGIGVVLGVTFVPRGDRQPAQDPKKAGDSSAAAFAPLLPGSRWEYDVTENGRTDRIVATALLAVDVGGRSVVQVQEVCGNVVAYSFWSVAPDGLYRYGSGAMPMNPVLEPVGEPARVLAAPVGAHTEWQYQLAEGTLRTIVPGGAAAGGGRAGRWTPPKPEDARLFTATLVAMSEPIAVGGKDQPCVHVRAVQQQGARTVDSWFARGLGLVREVVTEDGEERSRRELVQFTAGAPEIDPVALLRKAVGADTTIEWWPFPADQPEAWLLRSRFAWAGTGAERRCWRVLDGTATPFAADEFGPFAAMAEDEDFASRAHGLQPQQLMGAILRVALGLRLHKDGGRVVSTESQSIAIRSGADGKHHCKGTFAITLADSSGTERRGTAQVEVQGGALTLLHTEFAR